MIGRLYRSVGKRVLDLLLASLALLVALPLLIAVAIAVRVRMGSPVLFRQRRPGRHGRCFELLKFRTMSGDLDPDGEPLPDAQRLTPLGRRLRRWSIDELPELWNVVVGQMSLVGPRPLLEEYLERYSAEQARRHEVLPGITGWAQIHGRNDQSWSRRLELDVWYVDRVSLALDLCILWTTARMISTGKGVSAPGHATMPKFEGNLGEAPEDHR
jgi:lipopolysaccharide/colanic/teichoic acid biosynthesis glycosyltransferase